MFNIVLVHPEIPPNTGNVIRLAANTGCALHLIELEALTERCALRKPREEQIKDDLAVRLPQDEASKLRCDRA
jgi:hypothetical protein